MRVFLSSTYEDLVDERNAVYDRLSGEHDVVRMEDFGSRDEPPIEACLVAVESCQVYVLLLGARYGSIARDYNLSYTQVEYERACQCNLPVLAYVRDGFEQRLATSDDPVRLGDFRAEIERAHTVRRPLFTTPASLASQVAEDLRALASRFEARPAFRPGRRAIADTASYTGRSVRPTRLQLDPIVVVVADLGVLRAAEYPEHRGRRMRDKVREIVSFLEDQGANAVIFNQIPAPAAQDIVEQRVVEAGNRANIIVCLVRGASDANELANFVQADATVAVWHPDRITVDMPEGVRVAAYSPTALQECGLALDVERYLDAMLDNHVLAHLA